MRIVELNFQTGVPAQIADFKIYFQTWTAPTTTPYVHVSTTTAPLLSFWKTSFNVKALSTVYFEENLRNSETQEYKKASEEYTKAVDSLKTVMLNFFKIALFNSHAPVAQKIADQR